MSFFIKNVFIKFISKLSAFGDSPYARRDVYEQPSTGAQPATQPTGQSGGTPRSGETSNVSSPDKR